MKVYLFIAGLLLCFACIQAEFRFLNTLPVVHRASATSSETELTALSDFCTHANLPQIKINHSFTLSRIEPLRPTSFISVSDTSSRLTLNLLSGSGETLLDCEYNVPFGQALYVIHKTQNADSPFGIMEIIEKADERTLKGVSVMIVNLSTESLKKTTVVIGNTGRSPEWIEYAKLNFCEKTEWRAVEFDKNMKIFGIYDKGQKAIRCMSMPIGPAKKDEGTGAGKKYILFLLDHIGLDGTSILNFYTYEVQ